MASMGKLLGKKKHCKIFCEQMTHKLTFLEGVLPVTSGIKQTAFHKTVKQGGGSVVVWGGFAASGLQSLT